MSELMDYAVINMPFDMAMSTELSRIQYYNRAKKLLKELEELRKHKLKTENNQSEIMLQCLAERKELKQLREYKRRAENKAKLIKRRLGECFIVDENELIDLPLISAEAFSELEKTIMGDEVDA